MSEPQKRFINCIKDKLPESQSLVHTLEDVLDISTDSCYRRIRGETPLTFDEIQILCEKFNLSFDSFCNVKTENVLFSYKSLTEERNDVFECFNKISEDLRIIQKCKNNKIIYAAADIPSFQLFKFPLLTTFRLHNWIYSMVDSDTSNYIDPISFYEMNKELLEDSLSQIIMTYKSIPSIEIWTNETIAGFLTTLEYYQETYMFKNTNDVLLLCEELIQLLDQVFNKKYESNLSLYISDINIENNYILIEADDIRFVYLKLYSLNNIMTTDALFCNETSIWIKNIINKSINIDGSSEMIRKKFYYSNIKKVKEFMEKYK